jgi:hypothetical protein
MTYIEKIEKLNPCGDALRLARQYATRPQKGWDACERGDWMLWLIGKAAGKPGTKSRRKLVLVSANCTKLAWQWIPKEGKAAIRLAERYGKGDRAVTIEQLLAAAYAAAYAAYSAAHAADAADAATYAAYSAAHAADAADAADAAYAAAYAAYSAADAAAYAAAAAAYAARTQTLKKAADIIRTYYPKPPKLK